MIGVDVKLLNGRDLIAELKRLKEDVAVKAVKTGCKRSAEVLLSALRSNTPVFTGKLRFNLGVKVKYVRRHSVMRSTVTVSTVGKADNARNSFYWRFVERGHKTRAGNMVEPVKFIERTFIQMQSAVQKVFYQSLAKSLSRYGKKSANLR